VQPILPAAVVDSQWRVAQDWPLKGEGSEANNLLEVGAEEGERVLEANL
jgi:hypothetical protein